MSAPPSKSEYELRKQMLEEFKQLSKDEYKEIFRIIKEHNVEFTENSNGIFFDLNLLSAETFADLVKFMKLCKDQRANEESRKTEMDTLRMESFQVA
jgi:hypothetical protein